MAFKLSKPAPLTVAAIAVMVSAYSLIPEKQTGIAFDPDKTYQFTVLHTNDHHGRFWHDRQDQFGMAARMTLIEEIRKEVSEEGGHVLLLSGGDINTGVPESDLQDAVPDFKGMNMLGYDAMAVGNHEFDNPRDILTMQEELAEFPFLSANIVDQESGEPLFAPYTMFNLDGLRVAVMGLTTDDTPKTSNPENVQGLTFASPIEVARELLPKLEEKADVIIASTHMGHYPNGNHGVKAPGDVTLARTVNGIDLIVGGHSQDPLFEPDLQNDTWIVQAHEWGKYVGRADFVYQQGDLELIDYQLIPVNHKGSETRIPYHEAMMRLLSPYQEAGAKLVDVKIGSVDQRLMGERNEVRFQPTNLGTLLTRAFMDKTGADFSVTNGGGIRASINAGEITYKDALIVFPFGYTLTTVDMSGQQVLDYLEVVGQMPANSGAFAHFSGVEMVITASGIEHVRIGGKPLDRNKTYKMATLSFSARGGDKYPDVSSYPGFVDTGFLDAEVIREYIEKNSPINVADYEPKGVERQTLISYGSD
ncbi:bifunctional UDP-sugar hydrolase/5'-nucleotidase [Thalassotalea sp. G20_0]|uniref:bifunctional UDP-sugar hydrolase/5'-nucleotidase UshA n=1 Tax=Thalassotalea sp. G20_0 TaxID=2821093 RepID=UPI001ADCF3A7|nr:bifunctional UDP-sugar hydrolase/5'-nucleotidase UshA [Thalassotalea sp. G20_0]MBO9493770.1 bifunctional UDP-sugar hydrolase/5'-nucleotidase [Thalassotalea sp. G20_0]